MMRGCGTLELKLSVQHATFYPRYWKQFKLSLLRFFLNMFPCHAGSFFFLLKTRMNATKVNRVFVFDRKTQQLIFIQRTRDFERSLSLVVHSEVSWREMRYRKVCTNLWQCWTGLDRLAWSELRPWTPSCPLSGCNHPISSPEKKKMSCIIWQRLWIYHFPWKLVF